MQHSDETGLTAKIQGRVNTLLTLAYNIASDMPEEGRVRLGMELMKNADKATVLKVLLSRAAAEAQERAEQAPEEPKEEETVNEQTAREIMDEIEKEKAS
jgi:hypothetical protein